MVSGLWPESARRMQAAPDPKENPLQGPAMWTRGRGRVATLRRSENIDTSAQPHTVCISQVCSPVPASVWLVLGFWEFILLHGK